MELDIAKRQRWQEYVGGKYLKFQTENKFYGRAQEPFAKSIGVSQPTVSQWLNGRYYPTGAKEIQHLVSVWGKDVYDILGVVPDNGVDVVLFGLLEVLDPEGAAGLVADFRKWLLAWLKANAPELLDNWRIRIEG